jgi:hypothetical protein
MRRMGLVGFGGEQGGTVSRGWGRQPMRGSSCAFGFRALFLPESSDTGRLLRVRINLLRIGFGCFEVDVPDQYAEQGETENDEE